MWVVNLKVLIPVLLIAHINYLFKEMLKDTHLYTDDTPQYCVAVLFILFMFPEFPLWGSIKDYFILSYLATVKV